MSRFRTAGINAGKAFLVILATLIFAILILGYAVQFRDDDATLAAFFKEQQIPAKIGYYTSQNRTLRYVMAGSDTSAATVLYIHGAPSSVSYFKGYFSNKSLLQQAFMMAVDRPGYGYSGFGDPEPSLEMQSRMFRPLLDSLHRIKHPLVVVGVSYGTSVACRLAMDYPDLIDGLVLVAPALAPGEEKILTGAYFIEHAWVKWLIPTMLRSANSEKLHHKAELEKMLPYWNRIRVPVTYLQGRNDGLIYTTNAGFAHTHLVNAASLRITLIPGRGHLIAFLEKDRITKAIIEMIGLARKYRGG